MSDNLLDRAETLVGQLEQMRLYEASMIVDHLLRRVVELESERLKATGFYSFGPRTLTPESEAFIDAVIDADS